jgi:hypothetical protein
MSNGSFSTECLRSFAPHGPFDFAPGKLARRHVPTQVALELRIPQAQGVRNYRHGAEAHGGGGEDWAQ